MLMNINQMAICLTAGRSDGSALMVIGVSNVIPRHKLPFIQATLEFLALEKIN